ncbi:hypothetical protein N7G274_003028 [Stereocaulon virgatum]|uniref:F-box domain-containing protein n=1 Tax=Stereocaulon virgatum TaxID=373712 RepID=A0ABR4AEX8_9LECA
MQSEPNEINHKVLLTQNTQASLPYSHHGLDHYYEQRSSWPRAGEGRPISRRSASDTASSVSSSGGSDGALERPSRRLSPPSRPQTRSPSDRIAEHEKGLIYRPKKRNQAPGFTVIQRGKKSSSGQSVLTDFPNEVLTHILSHLPPASLSEVSLVSRRFHHLVTTPHAWRIAFFRFFPGAEALSTSDSNSELSDENDTLRAERRLFTRLTALASWRSEYILRTRLLRSISRGKPLETSGAGTSGPSRPGIGNNGSAHVTYNSDLVTIVDHLHATFGTGFDKRLPRFVHGATDVGLASTSDPKLGKVDAWGFADSLVTQQFADLYPGDEPYGLGPGDVIGVPNVMDVSQPYGMVYAEGYPGGTAFYRSTEEKRGRHLFCPLDQSTPESGIPFILPTESFCSVWIAKNANIPDLTEGLIGLLVGSSQGVLSSYSLGTNNLHERRLERGELTARWVLSPGVPIVAITVDENHSSKRRSLNRIWAVVLNALGEVFYLVGFPTRPQLDRALKIDKVSLEKSAWEAGRTVYWTLVEPTRRTARPDPFERPELDGSYTPRTSWNGMGLSKAQVTAETQEINGFLQKKPKDFRKVCSGWDMRRQLLVDFAASDENGAGEGIIVVSCGLDEGQHAKIKRFTRCKLKESNYVLNHPESQMPVNDKISFPSLFGGSTSTLKDQATWSFSDKSSSRRSSMAQSDSASNKYMFEEWRTSVFLSGGIKSPQIMATAIDMSSFALLTTTEDPLLCMAGSSQASSPLTSPLAHMPFPESSNDVPGQRARLLAVGTKTGTVILWNIRAPTASNAILENHIKPVRIIHTDSPQISCLALSALYLVHGGNDGLVQAWDPLASTTDPIRTLNSRFSSRARRRLIQAEASVAGVGINLFAAGAICLDPDPSVLRGMVSLGSHLRYWSYSSQAADQYKGNKRRLRRSERGSNQGGDKFSGTGRGALKDYIANEKLELEREKRIKRKEEERLSGRYGVDLLGPGATEDEILAYATMLSEEAARSDELRRKSASDDSSSDTVTDEAVASPLASSSLDELDNDMAEAIRLSLDDNNGYRATSLGPGDASASTFSVKYAKKRSPSSSPPRRVTPTPSPKTRGKGSNTPIAELNDLEFALQLSQAEEESRAESEKGKGRAF